MLNTSQFHFTNFLFLILISFHLLILHIKHLSLVFQCILHNNFNFFGVFYLLAPKLFILFCNNLVSMVVINIHSSLASFNIYNHNNMTDSTVHIGRYDLSGKQLIMWHVHKKPLPKIDVKEMYITLEHLATTLI